MTVTLRPHQLAACDAVEAAWRTDVKRPLVDACVGAGKSLIFAELARREVARGGRALVLAHTRELVAQNAGACQSLGLQTGINAAALQERTWRAPVISAAVQSVFRNASAFGPITLVGIDESHLVPHAQSGMYRELLRGLPHARIAGASGTVFRLQGGSLVEGEDAPFDKVVYRYSILDGIRDGYLVPAFSASAMDKMDPSKLRVRQGEYTGESQDAQMIASMDNHLVQMMPHKNERRGWLVFEASVKAARAMHVRMNEWGIRTGIAIGEMNAGERARNIEAYRKGDLQALVNKDVLTTGFDVQHTDMLVMRFKTKSLGKYVQVTGRLLRTIGGNIEASIAAGKSDGLVFDFGGNIDEFGPLDFIRPRQSKLSMTSCESCGARCPSAAARCWSCDATMLKNCPACLEQVAKYELDCPRCAYDMRVERSEAKPQKLLDTPSGAALIASWKTGTERAGGWSPIAKAWRDEAGETVAVAAGEPIVVSGALADRVADAKWLRLGVGGEVEALLLPNGASRSSARQVTADGAEIIVPLPPTAAPNGAQNTPSDTQN